MTHGFDPLRGALRRANPVRPECLPDPVRLKTAEALLEAIVTSTTTSAPGASDRDATQTQGPGNLRSVGWEGRTDAELLRGALNDREAFAVFYREHAVALYRWFAYRVERQGTVAAELTAETFAQALQSLPRFKGTLAGSGTSWLFGIARNLAKEHHRSRRVRDDARRDLGMPREGSLDDSLADADDRVDLDLLRLELDRALAQLSPVQRQAVTLRVVNGLDYPSIARATATSEQAVRLRVSRGLRALRAQLASVTNEEDL